MLPARLIRALGARHMVTRADEYKAIAAKVVVEMRDSLGVELNYDKKSV
jgi:hypothetical protein